MNIKKTSALPVALRRGY